MSESNSRSPAASGQPEISPGSVDPQSVEGLFIAALAKTAEARAAFLDEMCGGDVERRRRVEALLRAYTDAGSFLERPAGDWRQPPAQTGAADEVPLDFLTPTDKPGCLGLLGPYEILDVIGRGGMGVVLRALDLKLNRVVAIKVLAPELAANPNARRRFLREAQAAAAVSHPHVVTIHAVDEAGLPFLVMECIVGQSLQQKIDNAGPLRLTEILRIGKQVAEGLAAAHAQGLIHRDIKPANILLENGVERVKITDFGLARTADDVTITRTGEVSGTPQYMSPEQAQGERVDQPSDLFSLGCVLYAMCTGRSPFRAASLAEAIRRVCDDTPRPIVELNPEIPAWLIEVIERLLEKDPGRRFQSAEAVADELGQHLATLHQPPSPQRPSQRATAKTAASPPRREAERPLRPVVEMVKELSRLYQTTALVNAVLLLGVVGFLAAFPPPLYGAVASALPPFLFLVLALTSVVAWLGTHFRRVEWGTEGVVKGTLAAVAACLVGPGWLIGLPTGLATLWLLRRQSVRDTFRAARAGQDVSRHEEPVTPHQLIDVATVAAASMTFLLCVCLATVGSSGMQPYASAPAFFTFSGLFAFAGLLPSAPGLLGSRLRRATLVVITFALLLPCLLLVHTISPNAVEAVGPAEAAVVIGLSVLLWGVVVSFALLLLWRTAPSVTSTPRPWRERIHAVASQPGRILAWLVIAMLLFVLLVVPLGGVTLILTYRQAAVARQQTAAIMRDQLAAAALEADAAPSSGGASGAAGPTQQPQGAVIVDFGHEGLTLELSPHDVVTVPPVPKGFLPGPAFSLNGTYPLAVGTYTPVVHDQRMGWPSSHLVEAEQAGAVGMASMGGMGGVVMGPVAPPTEWVYRLPAIRIDPGVIHTLTIQRDPARLAANPPQLTENRLFPFLWSGEKFLFSPAQAMVVQRLIEAFAKGQPEVAEDELLAVVARKPFVGRQEPLEDLLPPSATPPTDAAVALQPSQSLEALFNEGKHPAWGKLIVAGEQAKTYRLSDWTAHNIGGGFF